LGPCAFTVTQLARLGPYSRTKLHEQINAGNLPARKAGHLTLVLHEDWEAHLKSLPLVVSGADRAAPPDTPDENPPPRRASEQEGRIGTRPSRNPQSRHDKDGGAATRGVGRG
jgi:hypothetical protein